MRILCVIDSLGSGGAQRQIVGIAKGLKKKGNDVFFLIYHEENFYLNELEQMDIPSTIIKSSGYIDRILKMRNFIRKGKFESILSFLEGANFMVTLAGFPFRKWKLVLGERNANPNMLSSKKLRIYRWFHFFCDTIASNSHANLEMVKKINPFLSSKKMKVIYNFVDGDLWKPNISDINTSDKLQIIVAASHQNHKNAKGLIESLITLDVNIKSKIKINWYGAISPDNSYYINEKLIKEYNLEEVITLFPATSNIMQKMVESDVVGLFSFYEGLPNVICEAMMLGKPVMTCAVADLPEILKGTENLLFNPRENNEIVEAFGKLVKLSKEELKNIGDSNRELGLSLFDKNTIHEAYAKLLK